MSPISANQLRAVHQDGAAFKKLDEDDHMLNYIPTIEQLICAALRGENRRWPEEGGEEFVGSFLTRSAYHGVQALLYQRLQGKHGFELGWPNAALNACRNAAIGQAMWEMRHKQVLNRVLARLCDIGVRPVFFKGTALAYNVYPSPFLRTRADTDLFVPFDARNQVCETLEALGFNCLAGVRGDLISHTSVYTLSAPNIGAHELDVHWRISNAQVLSRLFSYEELAAEALWLPALNPDAIGTNAVHALLLACVHRAGHKECPYFVDGLEYYGGDRLIWLYDVHRILGRFARSDYDAFLEIAERKEVAGVCLEAIEQARACFHTHVPATVCDALARQGAREPVSRFLRGTPMYRYYANFMAVEGVKSKLRLLVQILFPPKKYMRLLYSDIKPNWLLWLYLRRIAIETSKRIQRTIAK